MATTQVQTVTTNAEKAKLALAIFLVPLSVVGFYLLSSQGVWLQWLALLSCLVLAVVLFFTVETGRQLAVFVKNAWGEMHKVVWPAPKEAMTITAYVFAFVSIMALFLWMTDKSLEWLLYDLILGWRK